MTINTPGYKTTFENNFSRFDFVFFEIESFTKHFELINLSKIDKRIKYVEIKNNINCKDFN